MIKRNTFSKQNLRLRHFGVSFSGDMIASILLAVPGFFFIWMLITYVEHLISLRKYPKGPFPLPLVGNLLMLSKTPYLDFIEIGKRYGDVFSLSLGMTRIVIINSYTNIKEALITRGTDFAGRPTDSIVNRIPSNNFTSVISFDYSKSFVFVRKLAFKSLHLYGAGMKNIEDIVIEEVEKMCSILTKEAGKPVPIRHHLGNSLVNTICHLCFSKKYDSHDPEFQQILESMRMIIQGLAPG
ncbi:steroid 17-alpha-hydroxylase/17,20 lyase-like [Clytia hemisphaerica]